MNPDVVLVRAPNMTLEVLSHAIVAYPSGRVVPCGPNGLAILAAFESPKRFGDAIEELGARAKTPAQWIALTATIQAMVTGGALRDVAKIDDAPPEAPKAGYEHPYIHIEMLDDKERTDLFLAGIRAVVKPGDVVVDIGTGTGVLAIAAAKAGAARVYAIETSRIADAAEAVVAANGLSDRVKIVRGWSTRVELPERADVLVTEMIGHEPLAEDALLINWDARQRLLKPGARMVPRSMRLYAYPVVVPDAERQALFFSEPRTTDWTRWYDIDFGALLDVPGPTGHAYKTSELAKWTALAEPALLGEIDFTTCETTLHLSGNGVITTAGKIGAIVVTSEVELAPGVLLDLAPKVSTAANHWRAPVWFRAPMAVTPGQRFEVAYRHAKPRGDLTFSVSS